MSSVLCGKPRLLPAIILNDRSLLIRSTFGFYGHPAQLPGCALCSTLQNISTFLREYDEGRCQDYRDLLK